MFYRPAVETHSIGSYRLRNVFDVLRPETFQAYADVVFDLIIRTAGNNNSACVGKALKTIRNVDPRAVDIIAFDDHIAKVDADSKLKPLVSRNPGVFGGFGLLNFYPTSGRIYDARKLDEQTVAHALHEAAVMFSKFWLEYIFEIGQKLASRSFLIPLA